MTDLTLAPEVDTNAGNSRYGPDWIVLAIACVAQFMVVLDVSIVNVALPSIGRDLHYSPTGLQWVVNAYVLTFAGFLLLGGRAADLFGRRRVYLLGLFLFTAASLLGGLAQNSAWLTTARAIQGLGGALVSPATLTIIITTFKGSQRTRAIGVWGAMAGAGGAAGSLLGGVLTAELSWRWVLFVNIPIGIVAMGAAMRYLTELRTGDQNSSHRLDVSGAVTVTAGLGVLIYAIVGTNAHAWLSTYTLSLLGVAAALLLAFTVIELKVASHPLLPFRLFRSRSVSGANAVMLFVGAAFFSMWYFLSLYMQNVLGYSALRAGLGFLPLALVVVIGTQAGSRILPKSGVLPQLVVGTAFATGGFLWLTQISATGSYLDHVLGPGCILAFAFGILYTSLPSAATEGVPARDAGLASGVVNTSRQVGGSLGLAALATLATDRIHSVLGAGHGAVASTVALTDGYARAFAGATLLTLAALVCSFIVPSIRKGHGKRGEPTTNGRHSQPWEPSEVTSSDSELAPRLETDRVKGVTVTSTRSKNELSQLAGTWVLDPEKTTVSFRTKALWILPVKGTAKALDGDAKIGPDGSFKGTIVIDANSFDTKNKKRDEHLRSEDFLEVIKYPTIVFTVNDGGPAGAGPLEVSGMLTIHGRSLPMTLQPQVSEDRDAATVSVEAKIDRSHWGMSWAKMGARLSNRVAVRAHYNRRLTGSPT